MKYTHDFKNITIVRCIMDNIELADEETGIYFDGN